MIKALLRVRSCLAKYKEIFYLLYIVIMGAMVSTGLNSGNPGYIEVFGLAVLCWLLKMAVTDFNLKEIIIIFIMFLCLGVVFLFNGERLLIPTVLAISGAKDVDFKKLFTWSLVTKLFVTASLYILCIAKVLDNVLIGNTKSGTKVFNYCFGQVHPNIAYLNIFAITMLAVYLFYEKLTWYHYLALTLVMAGFYKLLACRTGFLVWILFVVLIAVDRLLRGRIKNLIMYMSATVPVVLSIITFLGIKLFAAGNGLAVKLDKALHGRFRLPVLYFEKNKIGLLGADKVKGFDNLYVYLYTNYGLILSGILILAITLALFLLVRREKYLEAILICVSMLYAFMEHGFVGTSWNVCFVLISTVIFTKEGIKKNSGKV